MPMAIRIHGLGGPEVLQWEDVDVPPPAAGEVQIRHRAIGLNYSDIYYRIGFYKPQLPMILGAEGAGVVEAAGPGVDGLPVGTRVAYAPVHGAYAEVRNLPARSAVPLPDWITDEQAAAVMLKGLMARILVRDVHVVGPGDTILVHAAAGGVGMLVCQWAKHLGATVIGTVGSAEKAAFAAAHGCDHPILYRDQDFVAAARELTGGRGVDVVYDMVGKDVFSRSLECIRRRGLIVSIGQASGPVEPVDVIALSRKGSLYLTRPALPDFVPTRDALLDAANDLFSVIRVGAVRVEVRQRYALRDAAAAQRDLEGRLTTGASVLIP
jgi:NADPH2:quinone reductase